MIYPFLVLAIYSYLLLKKQPVHEKALCIFAFAWHGFPIIFQRKEIAVTFHPESFVKLFDWWKIVKFVLGFVLWFFWWFVKYGHYSFKNFKLKRIVKVNLNSQQVFCRILLNKNDVKIIWIIYDACFVNKTCWGNEVIKRLKLISLNAFESLIFKITAPRRANT